MSTLSVATIKSASSAAPVFQNSSGTEIIQGATAWVNFNGTGTVAIRDSFNVSSVTDNATGKHTINFANAMANTDYCPIQYNNAYGNDTTFSNNYTGYFKLATGTLEVKSYAEPSVGYVDSFYYFVVVFGGI